MKVIPVATRDGVLMPAAPIPDSAVRVICDGSNYTVYEPGDELPPDPTEGATQ